MLLRSCASLLVVTGLLSAGGPVRAAEVTEYFQLDGIGNARVLTDSTKAIVERHDFLPYGEECSTGGCALNPGLGVGQSKKFTGKERDSETGQDYFGARYFASKVARFTTVDPIYTWRHNLIDPQRWNRYAYGRDNPLRYLDPDGRKLTYTDPAVEALYTRMASRSPMIAATLALYGPEPGKPDLTIGIGDVDTGADSSRGAEFEPTVRTVPRGIDATETAEAVTSATLVHGTITLKASSLKANTTALEDLAAHELGHADGAARDTLTYIQHRAADKNRDGLGYRILENQADSCRDAVRGELNSAPQDKP